MRQINFKSLARVRSGLGYTFAEIMIVITIGGVATLGASALAGRIVDLMMAAQMRADILQLNEVFLSSMTDPVLCRATFSGVGFSEGAARQPGGQPLQLNLPPPNNTLGTLRDARLTGSVPMILQGHKVGLQTLALTSPRRVASATGVFYTVNLVTAFVPTRNGQLVTDSNVSLQSRLVGSMTISLNGGGQIQSCDATAPVVIDPSRICGSRGTVYIGQNKSVAGLRGTAGFWQTADSYVFGFDPTPDVFSDQDGCVAPVAFKGERGTPGVGIPGPQGWQGSPAQSAGPPGPPGDPGADDYIYVPSDRRVKTELKPFQYGLEEVTKIRPIWFEYNGLAGTTAGEKHAGVMAQELEKVAPELVEKTRMPLRAGERETDVRSVRYDDMNMMLIRAIQEQQEQIDELKEQLK